MGSELVPEELWMKFCMFYCSARVPLVFRGCCAAVGAIICCPIRPPGPSTQNSSIFAHNIDFIYYDEICGGASKQPNDGSPEPNRRGKQWIRAVWLKEVFRGGVRGVRAGVRGGVRECSAPIEIRRNRKESQKSLFFEVTSKRYPRRCPRNYLATD